MKYTISSDNKFIYHNSETKEFVPYEKPVLFFDARVYAYLFMSLMREAGYKIPTYYDVVEVEE